MPADVEWKPLGAEGRTLAGRDGLRAYLEQARENRTAVDATPLTFDQRGRCVIVTGSMRRPLPRGFSDSQPAWVYFFDGEGALRRFEGFDSGDQASAAVEAWNAERDGAAPG